MELGLNSQPENQSSVKQCDDRELGVKVSIYLAEKRFLETAKANEEQSRNDLIDATKWAGRKFPIALRIDGKLVVVNKPFSTINDLDVYYPEEVQHRDQEKAPF